MTIKQIIRILIILMTSGWFTAAIGFSGKIEPPYPTILFYSGGGLIALSSFSIFIIIVIRIIRKQKL